MKSFKNFLVEKENPNNPSEEKPQISKSDAKKIQKMKDADPDTAKRIQAGLESSREAARRIKSGETRKSQEGQATRTRPSKRDGDQPKVGDQPKDPSREAQARQSGRSRTGTDTPIKDLPQADTAPVTPEKAAERDRFMSSRRGRPAGQGEVERAAAMNQAKADGADKPFKTSRSRGADLLDRLTGRTTRKRSSAIPPDAFGKPSGTDPETGKAKYVPPKDIPQRNQRVDPKTGRATQAGVKNFAMSQGGYARSGRDMPKAEFDKVKARADKIANDPTSAEYKKIEKKINQEYGGRRARRRPSNAPSFAQVKAQIDAKNPVKQTAVGPLPDTPKKTVQPSPKKDFKSFRADLDLGKVDRPVKSMPAKGAPLEVSKGGGASSTGSKPSAGKNRIPKVLTPKPTPTPTPAPTPTPTKPTTTIPKAAKDLLGPNPKPTPVSMPDTPKPAAKKTPKLQLPPKVKGVGGTVARGAAGTAFGLGVSAGIEKLPVNRQTKDALQTTAGVIGAVTTPVASTLLSLGGSTRKGTTTQPSASDRATEFKSDPNKVNVRSFKPAYDPKNPYDITKWKFNNDPGVNTKMTKAELEKLSKPKFADLRGSIKPGSVVPKGFQTSDPELAKLNQKELDKLKPKKMPLPGADPATTPKPDTDPTPDTVTSDQPKKTPTIVKTPTPVKVQDPEPKTTTSTQTKTLPQPQPQKTKKKPEKPDRPNRPMAPPPLMGGEKLYSVIRTTKGPWRQVKPK